ncbi:uncharacterized protein LOC113491989 [Trichoplusia ni]|uniref:Uncharacterized protein LOC113491989 n=1 Tax=Trichoplusia ni TaxID=7111 RepID=A0A7E5V9S4_TRINI|nr:uncharacterized protein LOC113491989 [Trichoplusia ni]
MFCLYNMDRKIVFVVLLCFVSFATGQQFRCYACGFSNVDVDQSCLTITNSTNIVNCPHQYCTILRQEMVDPTGVVSSFTRGCESNPVFLNHVVEDSHFRTYYRACTNSLCNIGNGIEPVGGSNLSPVPLYNGINLLVPGTGSAVATFQISMTALILSVLIFNVM